MCAKYAITDLYKLIELRNAYNVVIQSWDLSHTQNEQNEADFKLCLDSLNLISTEITILRKQRREAVEKASKNLASAAARFSDMERLNSTFKQNYDDAVDKETEATAEYHFIGNINLRIYGELPDKNRQRHIKALEDVEVARKDLESRKEILFESTEELAKLEDDLVAAEKRLRSAQIKYRVDAAYAKNSTAKMQLPISKRAYDSLCDTPYDVPYDVITAFCDCDAFERVKNAYKAANQALTTAKERLDGAPDAARPASERNYTTVNRAFDKAKRDYDVIIGSATDAAKEKYEQAVQTYYRTKRALSLAKKCEEMFSNIIEEENSILPKMAKTLDSYKEALDSAKAELDVIMSGSTDVPDDGAAAATAVVEETGDDGVAATAVVEETGDDSEHVIHDVDDELENGYVVVHSTGNVIPNEGGYSNLVEIEARKRVKKAEANLRDMQEMYDSHLSSLREDKVYMADLETSCKELFESLGDPLLVE
jgi:hypothetical protein